MSYPDTQYLPFRWLIEHDGWRALPPAPGDDVQGPDVRERIGKDGIAFSAYPIPRASSVFGRVGLERLPEGSVAGTACDISVEELCAELGLECDPEQSFRSLAAHLEEVKAHLTRARRSGW